MFMLKTLLQKLGSNNYSVNQFDYKFDTTQRGNYLFNTTIAGVEKADLCLLIGANLRQIAPVLNSRIGQRVRAGSLKVARIGEGHNQTYRIQDLGSDIKIIEELAIGTHEFTKALKAAKYPMIIVGDGVYARDDGYAILSLIHKIVAEYNIMRDDFQGFNMLHNHASIVGGLDIGFNTPIKLEELELTYLLGADELPLIS